MTAAASENTSPARASTPGIVNSSMTLHHERPFRSVDTPSRSPVHRTGALTSPTQLADRRATDPLTPDEHVKQQRHLLRPVVRADLVQIPPERPTCSLVNVHPPATGSTVAVHRSRAPAHSPPSPACRRAASPRRTATRVPRRSPPPRAAHASPTGSPRPHRSAATRAGHRPPRCAEEPRSRILVIGASAGGLAFPRELLTAVHQVRVYDQAPVRRTGGKGVLI